MTSELGSSKTSRGPYDPTNAQITGGSISGITLGAATLNGPITWGTTIPASVISPAFAPATAQYLLAASNGSLASGYVLASGANTTATLSTSPSRTAKIDWTGMEFRANGNTNGPLASTLDLSGSGDITVTPSLNGSGNFKYTIGRTSSASTNTVGIQQSSVSKGTAATLNFTGTGISGVSVASGIATITVSGGSGSGGMQNPAVANLDMATFGIQDIGYLSSSGAPSSTLSYFDINNGGNNILYNVKNGKEHEFRMAGSAIIHMGSYGLQVDDSGLSSIAPAIYLKTHTGATDATPTTSAGGLYSKLVSGNPQLFWIAGPGGSVYQLTPPASGSGGFSNPATATLDMNGFPVNNIGNMQLKGGLANTIDSISPNAGASAAAGQKISLRGIDNAIANLSTYLTFGKGAISFDSNAASSGINISQLGALYRASGTDDLFYVDSIGATKLNRQASSSSTITVAHNAAVQSSTATTLNFTDTANHTWTVGSGATPVISLALSNVMTGITSIDAGGSTLNLASGSGPGLPFVAVGGSSITVNGGGGSSPRLFVGTSTISLDNPSGSGKVLVSSTQTTISNTNLNCATVGSAGALQGYFQIQINGTTRNVPYYA